MELLLIIIVLLAAVYLFLIMPHMTGRPDVSVLFDQIFYAHRGLHDNASDAPENSMAAFKKAVDAGYGIELDVQLTKDRIPVVFHDATLNRVCGVDGKIRDYTYQELQQFTLCSSQERIPLFSDFLKLVDGKVPLIIEIKIYEKADAVCAAADELIRNYKGVYCIESFHPFAVKWYKEHRPEVIRGQLAVSAKLSKQKKGIELWIMQYLLTNFAVKPDFIAYDHRSKNNISRVLCRKLYRSLSVAWTIKSQKELDACRKDYDLFIFEGFLPDKHE